MIDLTARLGDHLELRTPLIGASGTVASVVDFAAVGALESYGAAVAKSVSRQPWDGKAPPRMAPADFGMLNGIGIQNPGIDEWLGLYAPALAGTDVPVWGSAVGYAPAHFAEVADKLASAPVVAIELNLSCPNLDGDKMFALDPVGAGEVTRAARQVTTKPLGAKLSPNAENIAAVATAVVEAGADFVVLTNTVWGAGIDVITRRPKLSAVVGGYSGAGIKPIALRCVWEVRRELPDIPIVGCGGVRHGTDVVEFLLAGASAVELGTVHFEEPRAGRRILAEVEKYCEAQGIEALSELVGAVRPWR